MKIIFFGSSNFAVPILEALKDTEDVVLVVTQPDREKGRDLKISPTPVKKACEKIQVEIFQPDEINSSSSIQCLKKFNADIFVVVSYGEILDKDVLKIPKIYPLNVHASLLPKYRGAAPINWAIANGEKETGVTIIKMNEKMDEGDIILKEAIAIENDIDAVEVSMRLAKKGTELLLRSIGLIKGKGERFIKQDNTEATYAPILKKEDGLIDWNWSAEKIYNRVRAFVPWPGCWTCWNEKIIKIWKVSVGSKVKPAVLKPGEVNKSNDNGIIVGTGEGFIIVEELQLEGKCRMKAEEFIRGHKDLIGSIFL